MTETHMIKNIPHPRKVFSRIGLSLFLYFIVSYLSVFLLDFAFSRFLPVHYGSDYYVWFRIILCQYLIGFPVIYFTLKGLPIYKYPAEKMGAGKLFTAFLICQGLAYGGNLIGNALNNAISKTLGKEISNNVAELVSKSNPIIVFIIVGIIGPVIEELIFRRFIIDRIRPYGEVTAVLFSGITFGMFHGNFYQLFYAAALGMLFAFIYVRTKSLKYPVILHCALNCTSVLMQTVFGLMQSDKLTKITRFAFTGMYFALALTLLAFAIIGLVKFSKAISKIYFLKNAYDMPKNKAFLYSCVNLGMILFTVTVLVEFALNIFR